VLLEPPTEISPSWLPERLLDSRRLEPFSMLAPRLVSLYFFTQGWWKERGEKRDG